MTSQIDPDIAPRAQSEQSAQPAMSTDPHAAPAAPVLEMLGAADAEACGIDGTCTP